MIVYVWTKAINNKVGSRIPGSTFLFEVAGDKAHHHPNQDMAS